MVVTPSPHQPHTLPRAHAHCTIHCMCYAYTSPPKTISYLISIYLIYTNPHLSIYLSMHTCGTIQAARFSTYLSIPTPQNIWNPAVRAPGESE